MGMFDSFYNDRQRTSREWQTKALGSTMRRIVPGDVVEATPIPHFQCEVIAMNDSGQKPMMISGFAQVVNGIFTEVTETEVPNVPVRLYGGAWEGTPGNEFMTRVNQRKGLF